MIKGEDFIAASAALGFDFYTSVPCSYLTPLLNGVLANSSLDHFAASSEGEAIGIAAGAYLAGRSPVVMMQNSGLGNAVNPLSSLNHVFGIPSLLIISWRGSPGVPDEPQHSLMGEVMHDLLDVLKIPHAPFPRTVSEILPTLIRAQQYMQTNERPFALVVDPGVVEEERLQARAIVRPPEAVHRKLQAEADPEIRDILSLFFCAVSETLITRTLLDIPRDDRVVEPVRRVMREHAEDESRHHRFFADFLTRAWPQLTLRQRQKIGPLIPRFVSIFIDADPINTERILTEVGLTRLDASQVVTETFTRESIINARLQSSKACLMTLSRAGVLGDTHVQDALGMYGFSAEEQLAEFEG